MSRNVIAAKAIILYARIHCDTLESELLSMEIFTHDHGMHEWANEQLSNELADDLIKLFDEKQVEDGVYSVIFLARLDGGADYLGDYWSLYEPIGEFSFVKMSREDWNPELAELNEDDMDILFPKKPESKDDLFDTL